MARPSDSARSLLPALAYLAREAREAGLDEVHDLINDAMTGVLQWIEGEADGRPHQQHFH